jgi:hypothetical protein
MPSTCRSFHLRALPQLLKPENGLACSSHTDVVDERMTGFGEGDLASERR